MKKLFPFPTAYVLGKGIQEMEIYINSPLNVEYVKHTKLKLENLMFVQCLYEIVLFHKKRKIKRVYSFLNIIMCTFAAAICAKSHDVLFFRCFIQDERNYENNSIA